MYYFVTKPPCSVFSPKYDGSTFTYMKLTLYQIDAFANRLFEGNPAAVCPLQEWLPDDVMQAIAEENNLSETAFFVPTHDGFHIRWFTPACEVDLCGHATLASAWVIFNELDYKQAAIDFKSRSGMLTVRRRHDWLEMDFPAQHAEACEPPQAILDAFNTAPRACLKAEDYIIVFESESDVLTANPDMEVLRKVDLRGVAITAASKDYDFVTRFFAPKYGINEDPVTGSAFTQFIPYWAATLTKDTMKAKQVSQRGGEIRCSLKGERVLISGKAVKYLQGIIELP